MRKSLRAQRKKPKEGEGVTAVLDESTRVDSRYGNRELSPEVSSKILEASKLNKTGTSISLAGAGLNPILNTDLSTVLQEIVDKVNDINIKVFGVQLPINTEAIYLYETPTSPIVFSYKLTLDYVILSWTPVSVDFSYYELRKGREWDTADKLLTTNNIQVYLEPILVGTHTYLLRSINSKGNYGEVRSLDVLVPPMGLIVITPTVIQNSVTLSWNVPTSTFRINYYIIKRNGIQIAQAAGTFYAVSEQNSGDWIYSVIGVDIAGNQTVEAKTSVTTTGMYDYTLYSKKFWQKTGTKVNCYVPSSGLLYFNVLNETYQQHFTVGTQSGKPWDSPQEQIDANYIYWLSPTATTGSYEEVFDFGTGLTNVVVTMSFAYEIFRGAFTHGLEIRTSSDNQNWSGIYNTSSFFAPSMRYVKVKVNITAGDDKALMALNDISVSLNLKKENDAGFATALASDPIGTAVYFEKNFIDVEGITVTPVGDTSCFAVYSFADVFYPDYFLVRVFNNAGVRVTKDVRWNARGIV